MIFREGGKEGGREGGRGVVWERKKDGLKELSRVRRSRLIDKRDRFVPFFFLFSVLFFLCGDFVLLLLFFVFILSCTLINTQLPHSLVCSTCT